MKLYFGEFKADYSRYHFPYQVWLLKEEKDDIEEIYNRGFLPVRNMQNIFYLSRNVRVDLSLFELSSENRRIFHKTENVIFESIPLSEFSFNREVQNISKTYCDERFGKNIFSNLSIRNIFKSKVYNQVFVFKDKLSGEQVGFAVCFVGGKLLQYAHAFYKLKYFKCNLGARMMLQSVIWSKENDKKYVYLGTCYEQKSLYKTQYQGVEFFNGFKWSNNLEELKELIKMKSKTNLFKEKDYINKFYKSDIFYLLNNYGIRVS